MARNEQGRQRYAPRDEAAIFFCEHCAGSMGKMTGGVWHMLGGAHLGCIVAAGEPVPDFCRGSLSRIPIQIPSKLGIWFRGLWAIRKIRRLTRRRNVAQGTAEGQGGALEALVALSCAIGKIDTWEGATAELVQTGIRQDLITAGAALSWAMRQEIDVSRVLGILGSVERMGADLQPIQESAREVGFQLAEVRRSHRLTCVDHTPEVCPMDLLISEASKLLSRV